MKKIYYLYVLGVIVVGFLFSKALSTVSEPVTIQEAIWAMEMVESGGDESAVGDRGKAYGPLQIHKEVVEDVNLVYNKRYVWPRDVMGKGNFSKEICILYLSHYGKDKSMEDKIRIWNGGPRGYKKSSTRDYLEKVLREVYRNRS